LHLVGGFWISRIIRRLSGPHGFFLLNLVAGSLLVATVAPSSPYAILGLLSLATLLSLLATLTRFSQATAWQRAALASSSIGGFVMLMLPLFLLISQLPILPPFFRCWAVLGSCGPWPSACCGPWPASYYSVINALMLAGIGSVIAALLYSLNSRRYIISTSLSGLSAGVFFTTISSTQLPVMVELLAVPTLAGILFMVRHAVGRGEMKASALGRKTRFLTKRVTIILLLVILVGGTIGFLWGFDTEAVQSLQVACIDWNSNGALTIGMLNPSHLPIHTVLNVTYIYENPAAVWLGIESMQIPAHTTGYFRFSFESSLPNATLSGTTFDASSDSFMASFNQRFSPLMYGREQTPGGPPLPTCTNSVNLPQHDF